MKSKILSITKIWLMFSVAIGAVVSPANAVVFSGTSIGTFEDPTGPGVGGPYVVGVGTSVFSWGDGSAFGSAPCSLAFSGASFSGLNDGSVFTLGTLAYFNGTIAGGTEATSVKLKIDLNFTSPSGFTTPFSFNFDLINRANTADPIASADSVVLGSFAPTEFFTLDGVDYTLKMAFGSVGSGGFSEIGEFFVFEGEGASAQLIGQITSDRSQTPPSVPDGSSCLALMGIALCALRMLKSRFSQDSH